MSSLKDALPGYRLLRPDEAVRRPCEVALSFREKLAVFEPPANIPWLHFEDEGLGPAKSASFVTADGEQFHVEVHEGMPPPSGATLYLLEPLEEAEGRLNRVLSALDLTTSDVVWISPRIQLIPHDLWRQDDNGHRFFVEHFACRADAEHAQRGFERKGHKQTYFVLPAAGVGSGP
jgi:hypothetical protein